MAFAALLYAGGPAVARDWEFGKYWIGQDFTKPPADIRKRRDCSNPRDPFSCQLLLGDGIWYVFENRKVVAKTVHLPSPITPAWIDPRDNAKTCKRRLERLMRRKFRIFTDDYGVVFVETVDMIKSRHGQFYNLHVVFRGGRMTEVYQTPLPDADD